MLLCRSG